MVGRDVTEREGRKRELVGETSSGSGGLGKPQKWPVPGVEGGPWEFKCRLL